MFNRVIKLFVHNTLLPLELKKALSKNFSTWCGCNHNFKSTARYSIIQAIIGCKAPVVTFVYLQMAEIIIWSLIRCSCRLLCCVNNHPIVINASRSYTQCDYKVTKHPIQRDQSDRILQQLIISSRIPTYRSKGR